jgi:xanthine dehydrogenase YagR molybdenum-binding subunit
MWISTPLEFRVRNYAEIHPESGKPWAGKALRTCQEVGAERFEWSSRDPPPA